MGAGAPHTGGTEEEEEAMIEEGERPSLEALERENADLRDEIASMKPPGTRRGEAPFSGFQGTVSRRDLLAKGGVAAVAAVAAGTLLGASEARADTTFFDKVSANEIVASTFGMRGYNTAA